MDGAYFYSFVLFHYFEEIEIQCAAVDPLFLSCDKIQLPQMEHFHEKSVKTMQQMYQ